jgi:predicted nucleic acid-binding protein
MIQKAIYLDVCALSRPFDDQAQMRVRLETVAVHLILDMVKTKQLILVSSPVHEKEINAIPEIIERFELNSFLIQYAVPIRAENMDSIREQAEYLVSAGFGIADATHLAFAEHAKADFISCDDRLIKLSSKHNLPIWVGSPILFCEKEGLS